MKPTRTHRLIAGFALALGLLGTVAWFEANRVTRMQETAALVAHTHEVQTDLNRLLSLVQDVETGARGFVVTGEPVFLEPFETARVRVDGAFRALCALAGDNPRQRADCDTLAPLLEKRIAVAQAIVDLRRDVGFEAARQRVASGEGKAVMDQIRAVIARMDAEEQTLLEQRSVGATREASAANLMNLALTGLGFTLLIGMFALVLRENRMRQRTQVRLDRFFTLSLDVFGIAGMNGYFKQVNPAFNQTLGYTMDELVTRPFLDLVHPDDRAATLAEVEKLGRGVLTLSFENRYQCQDGSWRWLSWKAQPVVEEGLIYCTGRDITGRKEAEAKITQLNANLQQRGAQLEEANKELESFSYSVSHDLRAPLRHVQGYVEMLQRATDGQLSVEARRYLNTITEASVEMGQLIDGLLAFSRMGRTEMRESRVPLDEVVHDTIRGLEMATTGRTIVWQTAPLPAVVGDPSLLKQVLTNLIGNAVKYSRMRDPAEIEIGCAGEEDGRIILFVRDNGAGFDMQYSHKLFGVFQRLHRVEEFEGTGIGLATVHRIVARHGGRVWAEGAVNQGATFYFTLKPSPPA